MERRRRSGVAAVLVMVLAATGCAANSAGKSGANSTTATTAPGATTTTTTGTAVGVTPTTIKLGIAMIDFACIPAAFNDFEEPLQQKGYQAFVDEINEHGGISGRKIVPVYKTVCPLAETDGMAACTAFADDSKVFAVVGEFGQITPDIPLCVTKQHHLPLITFGITQDMMDQAPPGLLLTPDILDDRRVKIIAALLKSQHTLDGKTVAILADSNTTQEVSQVLKPALAGMGVQQVPPSVVSISGTDTTAAQTQLGGFIEKWKTEHVNAVFLAGAAMEAKQFVEKVRASFPTIPIIADSTGILEGAQDEQKAHASPNPYTGMITAEGLTGTQHEKTKNGKFCRSVFETHTGVTVPPTLTHLKLKNGRENNIQGAAGDACTLVMMFDTIAKRVGTNLNIANWVNAVNNMGSFNLLDTTWASLHTGKYDADDTYGLVAYDPTLGDVGDWKPLTPVKDVPS
ncbi:MAG TPA: ABC transporter substrate-binding protein [Acidimicrobiia bacterium]|nr:ABC transporter substrate-binding protein [Acidimicrobiia bacterium]